MSSKNLACSGCWAKYLCGGGCAHTARSINGELKPYKWDCAVKKLEAISAIKISYNQFKQILFTEVQK